MPARIRFLGRYGHIGIVLLIGFFVLVGVGQDGAGFALLSGALIAAVAISVHAAERMAYVESQDEWRLSEQRALELQRQVTALRPQVSEV